MKPEVQDLAAEQAADLAALEAAAAGGVAEQQPQAGAVAEQHGPPPPSAAALQMAAMAVGILRPIVAYAVPALRTAPDELWAPVPEGVAAVMDHYGASAEWMQSPWARLGISLAPLAAFAAMEAIKDKPKEADPLARAAEPAAITEAPPGAKTVQIGTAQHLPEGGPA